jgi:hypothetical protein
MAKCSFCRQEAPDGAVECPNDGHPIEGVASPPKVQVTCPACGAVDDFTQVIDSRGSFSLPAFLFGGLIAVFFRNAGKARRVRCNKCDARFYVSSPLSKISRVIFWLLVTPTIIFLGIVLIMIIHTLFSH